MHTIADMFPKHLSGQEMLDLLATGVTLRNHPMRAGKWQKVRKPFRGATLDMTAGKAENRNNKTA